MATCTINKIECEFEDGQSILAVAEAHGIEIPYYCWHPGLSVVANCRICLAEVAAPNPRNDGKVETIPKLLPTCQTPAAEGQIV
ncbi:MAG: 2Fe-2S iron-sulfur cluster binding domain-containing protein, partial [Phycisphaerae bacterium]|nr:2Fe-2S iron-sulfur cluster binding domain-containing protein [Phycisphaerae bacterium]